MSKIELRMDWFKPYDPDADPERKILCEYVDKCLELKPGERIEIMDHPETTSKRGLLANSLWNILKYRYDIDTDIDEEFEDKEGSVQGCENAQFLERVWIVRK